MLELSAGAGFGLGEGRGRQGKEEGPARRSQAAAQREMEARGVLYRSLGQELQWKFTGVFGISARNGGNGSGTRGTGRGELGHSICAKEGEGEALGGAL